MSKRVIITAGASGIGLEIAKSFVQAGAEVEVCDADEQAIAQLGRGYPAIGATLVDVSDERAINGWFDTVLGKWGSLDVLVNNAGTKGPTGYVEDLQLEDWQRCLAVCLDAQFLCAKRAAPVMKRQRSGSIVNISSTAGLFGYGLRTPYAAAKWAVIGFTKSLAVELGPFGVRANAICPGSVAGERMEQVIEAEARSRNVPVDLVQQEYVQSQSIKRFVQPGEIGDMCVFLGSPAAKMVSGQAISVDGHTETFHL